MFYGNLSELGNYVKNGNKIQFGNKSRLSDGGCHCIIMIMSNNVEIHKKISSKVDMSF